MNESYKKIYYDLIGEQFNKVIIRYNPIEKKYKYCGFSHHVNENALEDLANLIIDDLVFYTFNEEEVLNLDKCHGMLEDLRIAAKYAYKQRLPKRKNDKTDGTMGEVLLDIFIQLETHDTQKLIARAKFTDMNNKQEIKGYDALYFTKSSDGICLWLGQAKAGKKKYCTNSIADDLKTKYNKKYFSDTILYIADKKDTSELDDILSAINGICFKSMKCGWDEKRKVHEILTVLNDRNVKIKIPCLIIYSKDIYSDEKVLGEYINKEIQDTLEYFDEMTLDIELNMTFEVIFYILPVKDVDYIRQKIIEMKKEAN